jgi:S-adenosylmethionine hydrolase
MALEEIRQTIIPSLSGFYLGHIDNYGNMKTTINKSYLKGRHEYGDLIKITLNGITKEAYYVNNMFAKEPETLVIAPGSSGMPDDPYLELIVWQHLPMQSARKFFPTAKAGDEIVLK